MANVERRSDKKLSSQRVIHKGISASEDCEVIVGVKPYQTHLLHQYLEARLLYHFFDPKSYALAPSTTLRSSLWTVLDGRSSACWELAEIARSSDSSYKPQ